MRLKKQFTTLKATLKIFNTILKTWIKAQISIHHPELLRFWCVVKGEFEHF